MKFITSIAFFCLITVSQYSYAAEDYLSPVLNKPLAPEFWLRDLNENILELDDFKGKPVIINFWATWCPPCLAELPSMNRAWKKLKNDGIAMVAINVGENESDILEFKKNNPIIFTVLLDESGEEMGNWPMRGLPTTFILNPEGRIVYQAVGGRDWDSDKILNKIRALKVKKKVKQK